jgi:hypothetical protein
LVFVVNLAGQCKALFANLQFCMQNIYQITKK